MLLCCCVWDFVGENGAKLFQLFACFGFQWGVESVVITDEEGFGEIVSGGNNQPLAVCDGHSEVVR